LARRHDYQVIIVSSPPHAAQLVGARLSRKLRIPYVADYRDPWTFGIPPEPYLRHPVHRRVEARYESSAMKRASLVVCNTSRQQKALDEAYEGQGIRTTAVPNGYDRLPAVSKPDRERFRIVYAGALYPYHNVRALMAACGRLRLRSGLSDEHFKIEFMGRFGRAPLATLADEHGLASCFRIHPRGTRQQALELQQSAAVLVSFDHWHGLSVPMKFYDYAQMYGDLLLLCFPDGALVQAAEAIGLKACDPGNATELDEKLDAALARWREYRFDDPADREGVYDRTRQNDRMEQLLDAIVSGEGA
jgi:glycosyltransferase involved in cell wall biosynthesis